LAYLTLRTLIIIAIIFLLLSPIPIVYFYLIFKKQRAIKKWSTDLNLISHQKKFDEIYTNVNGFILSREARTHNDAMEYTYGEIDFRSFIAILCLAKPNEKTKFYDLGSGTGKAVLACAMVFNVNKSVGIELFSLLHHAALEIKQDLANLPEYKENIKKINFINENFLTADFSDATIIFINATALFGESLKLLTNRLSQLKPGTIIITTSKKLKNPNFQLVKTAPMQMSWGVVYAYIHEISSN